MKNSKELEKLGCDKEMITDIKLFENGMLNKFWPFITIKDITDYKSYEDDRRVKCINDDIALLKSLREDNILNTIDKSELKCDNFEITYFKINKPTSNINIIDLSKLFSSYKLSNNVPFMKVVLNTHNDKYYKIFKDSIIYNNINLVEGNKIVDKKLCVDWTEDFYTESKYANTVNFIHSKNVILFKVCLNGNLDIYATLIIHINGDIECILKRRKYTPSFIKTERLEDIQNQYNDNTNIVSLIHRCNELISEINNKNYYSKVPINDFGTSEDIKELFLNPRQNNISIDFIDCQLNYDNENFQDKDGNVFPDFSSGENLFGKLIKNLSMYFRVKIEKIDVNTNTIYAHYKRVNNYVNQESINSAFRAYSNIYRGDEEKIINEVYNDFGMDMDFNDLKEEYHMWKDIMKIREQNNLLENRNEGKHTNIEEEGPDLIISKKDKGIEVEIKGIKSFDTLKRLISILTVLMEIYKDKFLGNYKMDYDVNTSYINDYIENIYAGEKIDDTSSSVENLSDFNSSSSEEEEEKEEEEKEEEEEEEEEKEDSDGSLDFGDPSSSSEGGGKEEFKHKSYYSNRLKEYDQELFKPDKPWALKQPNGQPVGYTKKCTSSPSLGDRQPIAITKKELNKINKTNDSSGPESYGNVAINIEGRSPDIFYICPEYWDMSKKISLRHDYVQENHQNDIVNPKSKGLTEKFILERSGTYWSTAKRKTLDDGRNRGESFIPEVTIYGLHPNGYGLPCCMNKAVRIKRS